MEQPYRPIEIRATPPQNLDVSFAKRTVELIVMPYEEAALVPYEQRMIQEIVTRGAFDGIEKRPNRVKANRDHDLTRLCGKAIRFHPSRTEGLVAEVRMTNTVLGEETLELVNEGMLGASAGFLPGWDAERGEFLEEWPTQNYRRLNKVWLHHIAMTPDPAYDSAQVLAVRQKTNEPVYVSETPRLDRLRQEMLEERYQELSRQIS